MDVTRTRSAKKTGRYGFKKRSRTFVKNRMSSSFKRRKTTGGYKRIGKRYGVRRGGKGRIIKKSTVKVTVQYRTILFPQTSGGLLQPTMYYYNFNLYNLGVITTSTGTSTPPNWNYAQDNFHRLRPYFLAHRRYRISKAVATLSDLYPNQKYNSTRISDTLQSTTFQTGAWIIRSDPNLNVWSMISSYRDILPLKGNSVFVPTTSSVCKVTCKPRYPTLALGGQPVTYNSGAPADQQLKLAFSVGNHSRKFRNTGLPTFAVTTVATDPTATFVEGQKDITYDYCSWNGMLFQYIPPIDSAGREYGMTGYSPNVGAISSAGVLTMNVTFEFKGKLPVVFSDPDYSTNRAYRNVSSTNPVLEPWA